MKHPQDPLLTQAEAAAQLGVKTRTLECWRSSKRYPLAFVQVGRNIRYRQSAVDAFVQLRTRAGV